MARNARFTLNPSAVTLTATGKVAKAIDWTVDTAPGQERTQRRDETGTLVWLIDVLDESDENASRSTVVAVEVSSPVQPVVEKFRPLNLERVEVSMYVGKTGQLMIGYSGTLKSANRATAQAA